MEKIPFVSYYTENNISPVNQNIQDLRLHFRRRESLLLSLGIIPTFLKDKRIIEFGPGSGHNSIYLASLHPTTYKLVDGNPAGIEACKSNLKNYGFEKIEYVEKLFLDFHPTDTLYDLVWAEACLPFQSEPVQMMAHLARFVAPGGCFVVTSQNGISILSEILRRLMASVITKGISYATHEKLNLFRSYYIPHLMQLKSMSRNYDDWILDNIIQPLEDRSLLSIPEIIFSLDKDFEIYQTQPKFIVDWRWYKAMIDEPDRGFNSTALKSYYRQNLNLIDYRFTFESHDPLFGQELEQLGHEAWKLMCEIQNADDSAWGSFYDLINNISKMIKPFASQSFEAIQEASIYLKEGVPEDMKLKHFPHWWGRGQEYVSLIRKQTLG